MKNILKILIISSCLLGFFAVFYYYSSNQKDIDLENICQNDELVSKLIDQNINPFSKLKFIKKRNSDCKFLLKKYRDDALKTKNNEYCSILDSSTLSLILLVNTYVHEMYDRETASKEFKETTILFTPYNYCPQYIDDIVNLITIKKRLGL